MPSERAVVVIGLLGALGALYQLHLLTVILEPKQMQKLLRQSRDLSHDDDETIDGVFPTRYARRMDRQMAAACSATHTRQEYKSMNCKSKQKVIRMLTYNTFRMFERAGAADIIGKWLQARAYDFVALQELNSGAREARFHKWAKRFGFQSKFLLLATSGFHVGFVSTSPNCQLVIAHKDGFAHGALHVKCEEHLHFIVTHLTPQDAKSRGKEAQWLGERFRRILRHDKAAAIAIMGDLNSPPIVSPFIHDLPWAIESLSNDKVRINLKRKFLNPEGYALDSTVRQGLFQNDQSLRDPCLYHSTDHCSRSVPTSVGLDNSHAVDLRLDHLLLSKRWHCTCPPCAAVVENLITDSLSDHYPLQVEVTYSEEEDFDSGIIEAQLAQSERNARERRSAVLGSTLLNALKTATAQGVPRLETIQKLAAADILADAYRPHLLTTMNTSTIISDQISATPLQLAERHLACNYTHDLAKKENETRVLLNQIKSKRQREWQSRSHLISGHRLAEEGWRVVPAPQGDDCRTACEMNTSGFCLESKAKDDFFLKDCDRMTTIFGCPFGCHSVVGDELPAFVSNQDNFHAGRCLMPVSPGDRRVRRQQHSRRNLLLLTSEQARKERRRKRLREKVDEVRARIEKSRKAASRPTDESLAEQFDLYGLELSSSAVQDKWCTSQHSDTSRLCPCFDAFDLVKAKPLESCNQACLANAGSRKKCYDPVLRVFNSRACPLLQKQSQDHLTFSKVIRRRRIKDSADTKAVDSLPLLLDMNSHTQVCLFSGEEKRTLGCAAKPQIDAIPRDLLPKARRLQRICPCVR